MSSSARTAGLIVFLIGVVLLIMVFFVARAELARPLPTAAAAMGMSLAREIGLLFLMGFAASSIAARGCQMVAATPPHASVLPQGPDAAE